MAVFDSKSRYVKPALETYRTVDLRGRTVDYLPVAAAPAGLAVGRHLRKQGQRLDHLAKAYLSDANGYWRIAELNDAILPDALDEAEFILIPAPTR
jgi:hypothetical protein